MISDNNPAIDVDELMAKIHQRLSGGRASLVWSDEASKLPAETVTAVATVEALLASAEAASRVRTSLGSHLKSAPFFSLPGIQHLMLKCLAFLFRDQRNVNAILVDALRHTLALNVRLSEQIDQLKTRVDESRE